MTNWVKCSEEMPRPGKKVLIAIPFPFGFKRVAIAGLINNEWLLDQENKKLAEGFKVTHWAPLPEAPKDD